MINCLLEIDPHYVPRQLQSIHSLLLSLNETAKIFINATQGNKENTKITSENKETEKLGREIADVFAFVDKSVKTFKAEDDTDNLLSESDFNEILSLPLAEKYKILLKDLRFGYSSMKT